MNSPCLYFRISAGTNFLWHSVLSFPQGFFGLSNPPKALQVGTQYLYSRSGAAILMSDDLLQDDVSEEVIPHERQSTGEPEEFLREASAEQSSCRPEKAWEFAASEEHGNT